MEQLAALDERPLSRSERFDEEKHRFLSFLGAAAEVAKRVPGVESLPCEAVKIP